MRLNSPIVLARTALMLLVASILTSCGAIIGSADDAGPLDLLREKCKTDAGWRIYSSADNVEGFVDRTERDEWPGCTTRCREALLTEGYKFVEAMASRSDLSGFVSSPGLYRFSQKPVGHPACAPFEDWQRKTYGKRLDRYANVCVATERVGEISAGFAIEKTWLRETHPLGHFLIGVVHVKNLSSEQLLAEFKNYSFHWAGGSGPRRGGSTCQSTDTDRELDVGRLYTKILVPKR